MISGCTILKLHYLFLSIFLGAWQGPNGDWGNWSNNQEPEVPGAGWENGSQHKDQWSNPLPPPPPPPTKVRDFLRNMDNLFLCQIWKEYITQPELFQCSHTSACGN